MSSGKKRNTNLPQSERKPLRIARFLASFVDLPASLCPVIASALPGVFDDRKVRLLILKGVTAQPEA
jgi:hypothetical protein